MRCRICELPHKNCNKYVLWIEFQICRICAYFLEIFSWNNNYLDEYWMGKK